MGGGGGGGGLLFALYYSLTSSLQANCSVVTTEVGDEETFNELGARVSKEHNLLGRLTWHSPGEPRDVNKYQGPQRVKKVFPKPVLFHIGVVRDKKATEAETPAGTAEHNLFIRENTTKDDAEQDNEIDYPETPVGGAGVNISAEIARNSASGKSKQKNRIGGPRRGEIQRQ